MDIVITQWALDSYLDLKHSNSISNQDYNSVIRPDVLFAEAVLCGAYAKGNTNFEKRKMAIFKTHLELIRRNQFTECGRL